MFASMQTLRTADERFADLPEFPYSPNYCEVPDQDGGTLRVAWVEDGPAEGNPVLMLHGEPSWSFLYRRMMPILAAAGHRVVCPDLVGFGRSDKPTRIEDHTYARHVEWMPTVSTIRSSRTPGTSCKRTRARSSPRPLFDFCDSRSSAFADQQATLTANVPFVRKLGLAASKPSAVPLMS
jgi:hypothetical protein